MPSMQAQAWLGAANSAANGNYGGALGEFGTMGLWGMGGRVAVPAMILQTMYNMRNPEDHDQYADAGTGGY
jgi:hypothetical protein